MPQETPQNGVSVALITAGATIVASQNQAGWLLVAVGLVMAKRKSGRA